MVLGLRVHVYTMYTIHRPLRRWYWGAKSQFLFVIQIIWLLFPVPSVLSHLSRADIKDFILSLCLVPALMLPQAPGSRGLRSTLSLSWSPSRGSSSRLSTAMACSCPPFKQIVTCCLEVLSYTLYFLVIDIGCHNLS